MPTTNLSALTRDDALAALRAAVEAKGEDYTYVNRHGEPASPDVSCYYTHPTADGGWEPGCIVGHVLVGWGVSLDDLRAHEGDGAGGVCTHLGIPIAVAQTLSLAQQEQDAGGTWGEALRQAESGIGY